MYTFISFHLLIKNRKSKSKKTYTVLKVYFNPISSVLVQKKYTEKYRKVQKSMIQKY